MINARTHRKYERVAGMKFVAILHKGHWGHWADCAEENGTVWDVNKATGEKGIDTGVKYEGGRFMLIPLTGAVAE